MTLAYEKEGHIVKVGLNRPKEKNALDTGILIELHKAWQEINKDDDVRLVILHSCLPDIFCAGMDLKTAIPIMTRLREPETEAEKDLMQFGKSNSEAMLKPNIVNKPVIAANGPRAVQGIIRCLRETCDMNWTEAFARELEIGWPIFSCDDSREGFRAQKEKRKPNFA